MDDGRYKGIGGVNPAHRQVSLAGLRNGVQSTPYETEYRISNIEYPMSNVEGQNNEEMNDEE
jgi:hypothetical protein